MGQYTTVAKPTITVDTSAYADGDDVMGKLYVPVARGKGGSGLLTRLQLRSRTNITVQTFLHIFDRDPSGSTFTKNSALAIAAADYEKLLKTFAIASADWVTPKGASPWYTVELLSPSGLPHLAYDLGPGDASLYLALEADGAITFGGAAYLGLIAASDND